MSGQNNQPLNPTLIYTYAGLMGLIKELSHHSLIALDTESDSLYSYYPKVCLIQLTVFADPQNPDPGRRGRLSGRSAASRLDRAKWARCFSSPDIQVVMHAAENDILTLQRDFQFQFTNIFDTQLAARILGWKGIGLAAILEREFGVHSNKRMQRTNWGTRPLTPQQIAYAQMDTHYLPKLRAMQMRELLEKGRIEEAADAFRLLTELDYAERPVNERTVWQMKNIRKVPREDRGVLEAVWQWRENEAQRRNCPPFRVANDQVLCLLASERPADKDLTPKDRWTQFESSQALRRPIADRDSGRLLAPGAENARIQPPPAAPIAGHRPGPLRGTAPLALRHCQATRRRRRYRLQQQRPHDHRPRHAPFGRGTGKHPRRRPVEGQDLRPRHPAADERPDRFGS